MPGLTVTEKEFWKTRIAARIAKRVEAIKAQHPALFERVKREGACAGRSTRWGWPRPIRRAGTGPGRGAALDGGGTQAQRAMLAALRGVPIEESSASFNLRYGSELPLPLEAAEATGEAAGGAPGAAPGRRPGRAGDRPAGGREGEAARHRVAGDLAGADQAVVGQGRRAARRRDDVARARGAGHRAGEGGLMPRPYPNGGGGVRAGGRRTVCPADFPRRQHRGIPRRESGNFGACYFRCREEASESSSTWSAVRSCSWAA